jgi:hypothetical protein
VPVFFIDKEEKSGEDRKSARGTFMGFFTGISHYLKICDMVESAYTNYKVSSSSYVNYYSVFINKSTLGSFIYFCLL